MRRSAPLLPAALAVFGHADQVLSVPELAGKLTNVDLAHAAHAADTLYRRPQSLTEALSIA